jgi:phospholipid/cholesterol/gamma-HCH transport system substrate-binding protein
MAKAIQKHLRDFIAIIVMTILALIVAGYILSHQRFYLPGWVPIIGTEFFEVKGEFETSQSVMPGQGQTVDIAGVPIGEIKNVELEDGRGVVTMSIRPKYAKMIRKDASMLLRPKTGLKDMIVELDPGTSASPRVPDGYTVPIRNTLPDVNLDEFFSALDRDTRDYLNLLLSGGGSGLKDQGEALSAVFRRFEPTNRDIREITKEVSKRRKNLARVIHSFQLLTTELGRKDKEIAQWVASSSAVFDAFARQDAKLAETIRLLPSALASTEKALGKADRVATDLGPAARSLLPGARAFAQSLRDSRKFFRETVDPIRDQIRPFARDAQPTIKVLRPAQARLAKITPQLTDTFRFFNTFLNALTYNPPGSAESVFFYTLWGAHIGGSVFSTQDAHGPIRRGVILTTCRSLGILQSVRAADRQLSTIIDLLNPPTQQQACANPGR